jgi:hypothetical protein
MMTAQNTPLGQAVMALARQVVSSLAEKAAAEEEPSRPALRLFG